MSLVSHGIQHTMMCMQCLCVTMCCVGSFCSTVRLKYPNAEGKMEWWYGTVTMYDKPYHTIEFDEENNPGPTKSDTVCVVLKVE